MTVLDRDVTSPEGGAEESWEQWQRPGVNQFRHPHIMLPAAYQLLSTEVPEAVAELQALGATTHNMLAGAYDLPAIGGRLEGDERFDTLAARRPVIEAALGNTAAKTAGITVRRGVAVAGLLSDGGANRPRVTGVRTRDGESIAADLVIDAGGRNSPVATCSSTSALPPPLSLGTTPDSWLTAATSGRRTVRCPRSDRGRWNTTTASR
ncbi:NAD(P)/FAD-dependent oxidoreductase [Nocardia sp. CA-107356]|uniref:NAD(P)/FAD-dependent oxidoreductase n=1 Tax=Nocardia sp. CA-107356 TaxID=3239972 RepID=UPI003D92300A